MVVDVNLNVSDICAYCPNSQVCDSQSPCRAKRVKFCVRVRDFMVFTNISLDVEFEF